MEIYLWDALLPKSSLNAKVISICLLFLVGCCRMVFRTASVIIPMEADARFCMMRFESSFFGITYPAGNDIEYLP